MKSLFLFASAFILGSPVLAIANSLVAAEQLLANPFPYEFPDLSSVSRFPMESCHGVTLEEATVDQLQNYMAQGILSSVKIVECYLKRRLQVDQYLKYDPLALARIRGSKAKMSNLQFHPRAQSRCDGYCSVLRRAPCKRDSLITDSRHPIRRQR